MKSIISFCFVILFSLILIISIRREEVLDLFYIPLISQLMEREALKCSFGTLS